MRKACSKSGIFHRTPYRRITYLSARMGIAGPDGKRHFGRLTAGCHTIRCTFGRSGLKALKREGDGATPFGAFCLIQLKYRADRTSARGSLLSAVPLKKNSGWCDDPTSGLYNREIRLPFAARHEKLWRNDHLYDTIIVLNHNQKPTIRFFGSAIFFHLCKVNYAPTEGCIAISAGDMRRLIPRLGKSPVLKIL